MAYEQLIRENALVVQLSCGKVCFYADTSFTTRVSWPPACYLLYWLYHRIELRNI